MIKLIDILKEINIQKKTKLGSGESTEGEVYDFVLSPDKVIKKYTEVNPEFKYAQYDFMKQYPEFFVKIYEINPRYVVMEKVKVPVEGLKELQHFINKEANINFVRGGEAISNIYARDVISGIHEEVKKNKNDVFQIILEKAKQSNKKNLEELLIKIYNFFSNASKTIPNFNNLWLDIHSENIGENKQGDLKLFDINYDPSMQ